MSLPTTSGVVRAILSDDVNLPADEVIRRARTHGLRVAEKSIRDAVYTVRSELKRGGAKPAVAPAAAQKTSAPKVERNGSLNGSHPSAAPNGTHAPAAPAAGTNGLAAVLANVAQVNAAIGACGGVEQARQAAEAVRACGGVDEFVMCLDLLANIRGNG